MKRKRISCAILLFAITLALNIASAELFISQPASLYNMGDELNLQISLHPYSNTNDFLTTKIVCDDKEVVLSKNAYFLNANEKKNISINLIIDPLLFNNLEGTCLIETNFGQDSYKTQEFELSDKIEAGVILSGAIFNPGEVFTITGEAKRINGKTIEGFAETNIPGTNSSVKSVISKGKFSLSVTIPSNTPAGNYMMEIKAYEKDSSGSILNLGVDNTEITVKQKPKKIEIALNAESFNLPINLSHKIILYDQSDKEITTDVSLTIYDFRGEIYAKKIVSTNKFYSLPLANTAHPGYWTIEASHEEVTEKRIFLINELEEATFTLQNQTLTIKNTGNVPYKKDVVIKIGDKNEIRSVSLEVNEEEKLKLAAPDGDYKISVSESSSSQMPLGTSYLTGGAVGIRDLSALSSSSKTAFWFWGILILILIMLVVFYYRRVKRRAYVGKAPLFAKKSKLIPITPESFPSKEIDEEVKKVRRTSQPISSVGSSKEQTAVIALKIKNYPRLKNSESSAMATIERAVEKAKDSKARVYEQGLFKMIVLSPKLTQKTDLENSAEAIKIAQSINLALQEFNKKYAIKIDYGIGVHVGDMYLEMFEGKPKFTSLGNTTILAKNVAEKANNELFISPLLHRKVYNIVKGETTQSGMYKVNFVRDRSEHSQFIERFMKKKDQKS